MAGDLLAVDHSVLRKNAYPRVLVNGQPARSNPTPPPWRPNHGGPRLEPDRARDPGNPAACGQPARQPDAVASNGSGPGRLGPRETVRPRGPGRLSPCPWEPRPLATLSWSAGSWPPGWHWAATPGATPSPLTGCRWPASGMRSPEAGAAAAPPPGGLPATRRGRLPDHTGDRPEAWGPHRAVECGPGRLASWRHRRPARAAGAGRGPAGRGCAVARRWREPVGHRGGPAGHHRWAAPPGPHSHRRAQLIPADGWAATSYRVSGLSSVHASVRHSRPR
jgi:hypothetical protein